MVKKRYASIANPILLLCLSFGCVTASAQTLVEQLGYPKDAILLIINNDDAGMCHAANRGTIEGMQEGLISSATIMFNCPWATEVAEFAKSNPDKSFGVHLTLTSEWKNYKWAPLAPIEKVRSLVDSNGYFWKSVEEVYQHGNADQAYEEGKAQIEKALSYGIPITHIDSHMGTFQLDSAYFEQYARLAKTFNLPLRMASQSTLAKYGQPDLRERCKQMGLIFTDYLIYEELRNYHEVEEFWLSIINKLEPGVTELYLHASELTPELEAITGTAHKRADELKAFTKSSAIREALARKNVQIISYRPLMELQQKSDKVD